MWQKVWRSIKVTTNVKEGIPEYPNFVSPQKACSLLMRKSPYIYDKVNKYSSKLGLTTGEYLISSNELCIWEENTYVCVFTTKLKNFTSRIAPYFGPLEFDSVKHIWMESSLSNVRGVETESQHPSTDIKSQNEYTQSAKLENWCSQLHAGYHKGELFGEL